MLLLSWMARSLAWPWLIAAVLLHGMVCGCLVETSNHVGTRRIPSIARIALRRRWDAAGPLLLLPLLVGVVRMALLLVMMNWVRITELGESDIVDKEADDDDHKTEELRGRLSANLPE